MCRGMIGRKIGMTGMFNSLGELVPVTALEIGPCFVTQIKNMDKDGYIALQLGFEAVKASSVNRPLKGHMLKSGKQFFKIMREFVIDNPDDYKLGQKISVDMFSIGEHVNVSGKSKGRGFSGVIKRHGFHGGKKTHGSHSHRIPGSIGCSAWPAKVIKGKKMPGRYGNVKKTVKKLEIIDIRSEENIMIVKGATPGSKSGLVYVAKAK